VELRLADRGGGRKYVSPSPGTSPTFTYPVENRASADAIRTSHIKHMPIPAPTARPFTIAMTGLSIFSSVRGIR
jgi:hypothetical protein